MWLRTPRATKAPGYSRRRLLLWATLFTFIFGLIRFGEPLEDALRNARNLLHEEKASGTTVIVAIDDRSVEELGQWPWPRARYAEIVNRLVDMGASRIVVDLDFTDRTNPADDKLLQAALKRAAGKVILPVNFTEDPVTHKRTDLVPLQEFRRYAELASNRVHYNYRSEVWSLNYAEDIGGRLYPSVAALTAGAKNSSAGEFPLDYSISIESIPVISATDLIKGRAPVSAVRGKDVIVSTSSMRFSITPFIPRRGQGPVVYVHALGIETLKSGQPITLGWVMPFIATFVLMAVFLFSRPRWLARSVLMAATLAILVGPVLAENRLIFLDIMPSLALLLVVTTMTAWSNFRQSYRVRGMVNAITGLPNLNALREDAGEAESVLIATRIHNYAEITSALPTGTEKELAQQVVARLSIGAAGAKIYQGDEGIFVWLKAECDSAVLGDQLEALHAICRTPVIVAGTHVDLAVSFGVDAGNDRSVSNRIGSALVAADEASEEGRRWKAFDAAKLKDAAWKLSLLGRLDAAIDSGEIWVAYQPKLDLNNKRIVGAEALARWTHPDKGEIGPGEFIFTAEQNNRIEKLTSYILEDAIKAAAAVDRRGIKFDVAVNLSARLLDSDDLVGRVASLLAQYQLPPSNLTLEVTESAATGGDQSMEVLKQLREIGVNVSVDDYGTGFSTLEALKKIPATEIKIDMGFVRMIDRSQSDRLMVNSTIQLAHSLGRTVVAEGVETDEILQALEAMGCDQVQGYLIGRPMRLAELIKLLPAKITSSAA